jgi:hypothetical protein
MQPEGTRLTGAKRKVVRSTLRVVFSAGSLRVELANLSQRHAGRQITASASSPNNDVRSNIDI